MSADKTMTTGLLYDERFLLHNPGNGHPERKERIERTWAYLKTLPWFNTLKHTKSEPAEESWIAQIHEPNYIRRVRESSAEGCNFLDTLDVGINENSFNTALLAAGGALKLADFIFKGELQNAFALLRPPGHHAEPGRAMGFCLFNNIAILARYIQKQYGIDKVLILDWDVHHGNGTQHTFEENPGVYYISLHQYPFYPGTGAASETGSGRGRGFTLNCPMPAGVGDKEYQAAFLEKILPAIDQYKPQIILISAGFDAHRDDPLAQICLSTECFGWMTERTMETAKKYCGGKIISLLEGGYHLEALPRSIARHVAALTKCA